MADAIALAAGIVRQQEKCRLDAYWDSVGERWTVGWGATGPAIVNGTVWTQEQADQDLEARLLPCLKSVEVLTTTAHLTPWQLAALVDLEYNAGRGVLGGSHLLQFILARDWIGAAKRFLDFDHARGVEIADLLKRRMIEAAMFLDGIPG
jgi:lysozyme